jgi:Cupredoxin-like domain
MRINLILMKGAAMKHNHPTFLFAGLVLASAIAVPAAARAGAADARIRFRDNQFIPQQLIVPAGRPLALEVVNAGAETIEFESFKLNREKVVPPGGSITVRLPALSPGSYDFYDDFHQDVPEGAIVAK